MKCENMPEMTYRHITMIVWSVSNYIRESNRLNALKTVSMRIRGYDEETESYTNDVEQLSGEIADLTKTATTPGGISLFTDDAKTEFKSTKQLFDEISNIYQDLTDKNQAQLLEILAGKRQGQIVGSILNNYETVTKSMDSMANSAGNAQAEMNVVMDSIDYKINQLKETGTGIAQNLFDRSEMKTLIDMLAKLAESLDFVTDKAGLLGTIGLGAGLFKGIKDTKNSGGLMRLIPIINKSPFLATVEFNSDVYDSYVCA